MLIVKKIQISTCKILGDMARTKEALRTGGRTGGRTYPKPRPIYVSRRGSHILTLKDRLATRRGILAAVSSWYDPPGLLALFVLNGKHILQDICKLQID